MSESSSESETETRKRKWNSMKSNNIPNKRTKYREINVDDCIGIYGEKFELNKIDLFINKIDYYLKDLNKNCKYYKNELKIMNNNNNNKINDITKQKELELKHIKNGLQYDIQSTINEYNDDINDAKQDLLNHYLNMHSNIETLINHDISIKSKKMKHNIKNNPELKKKLDNKISRINYNYIDIPLHNIQYNKKPQILSTQNNINNNDNNKSKRFNNELLQQKWDKISNIKSNDISSDLATLQNNLNKKVYNIKQILSLYPVTKIEYISSKNIMIINDKRIKIGTKIFVNYKDGATLVGYVTSINDDKIWCKLSYINDETKKSLIHINININDIQSGNVKVTTN